MPRTICNELPTGLTELACLVADSSQPEEVRCHALESLVPTIEAIARQVTTGYRRSLRDDLIAESRTVIWLHVRQYNRSAGRFEDWCRTVLYNYAVDLWRKSKSGPVRPALGGDETQAALELAVAVDDNSDEVMERCRELRQVLDKIRWAPTRGVHYFAVLLLQLRFVTARHLTHDQLSEDAAWRGELPELVEWLLPWDLNEDRACLRQDWPPLSQLWSAARDVICDTSLRLDAPVLCQVVGHLLPASSQLTPDVWNQWVHRAKYEARHRLQDEVVWTRCFSRLLPDRLGGGSS